MMAYKYTEFLSNSPVKVVMKCLFKQGTEGWRLQCRPTQGSGPKPDKKSNGYNDDEEDKCREKHRTLQKWGGQTNRYL